MHIGDFYGQTAASGTMHTGTTNSSVLMPDNKGGRKVLFYNHHAGSCFLKFGLGASVTNFTVKLSSGSYYETPMPIHTGSYTATWDSAGGMLFVTLL